MRVVSGRWGGRVLKAPKGDNTRPTMDAHRETLFNMIVHRGLLPDTDKGVRVIDFFAGTGALSFELLSRIENVENSKVVFFEKDKSALACIEQNIESLRLAESGISWEFVKKDRLEQWSHELIEQNRGDFARPFFIFCDPPYNKNLVPKAMSVLESFLLKMGQSTSDAVLVVECEKELNMQKLERLYPKWSLVFHKEMGVSQFLVFKRSP